VGAFPLDSRYGLTRGFDVYEEMYRQMQEPEDFEIQQARADDVVAQALEWYRGQAGGRRFLWVHVYDPHAPYDPPEPYRQRFADDAYLGEVAFTDASLLPLLEEARRGAPAPLLVVTADHGEARGDHGELTHGLFAYEATLHVPLFLWCPDLLAPSRDQAPARHVDILPTVLEALGDRSDRRLPGRSLLAAKRAEAPEGTYFEALSAAFNRGWAPLRGLMAGGHKYVELPVPEIYHLPSDPAEAKNLVAGRPDALRRLAKRLTEIPVGPSDRGEISAEEAAKLRSLGYLAGSGEAKKSYGPEDDPKNLIAVDGKLHEVVELYQQGRGAEAIPIARSLVAGYPKMKQGYLQLAFLLQHRGDLAGALRVYAQADAAGLGSESLDRKKALLLSEMGRPKKAVALLEKHRESEDLETLNALGIALTDAGRPGDGLAVFQRALQIQPKNAQAHQNSGIALLRMDRVDQARQSLETALSISKRAPRALNALGVAWKRLGAREKALEAWARCVQVDPEQFDALYNLGRVAGELGNMKLARQALGQFVATAPPSRYGRDIREVKAVLTAMGPA
jgi:tetratricopeptide (TPR) repeat protein